ncbi:hypothetical protein KM043_018597 [Ampulex compressa]|nr:hypothetical protein KM043_018597 [Ampulex compressa]
MKLAIMFYLLTILCKFRLSLGEECNSPWSMELTLCEDYMKLAQSETRAISLSLLSEYMKTVAKLENMLSNLRANNHVLDRKMKMELNKTGDIIDMLIRQGRNVGHCLDASTEALIRILEDGQLSILECVVVTTEFFVTVSKDIVKASYLGKQLRQDLKNMSQICFVNSTSNENLTSINIEFANAECRMVEFKQKYQTNSYLPIETLEEMMLKTNECIKEQDRTISKKVLDVASHTVNCISTT